MNRITGVSEGVKHIKKNYRPVTVIRNQVRSITFYSSLMDRQMVL